MGFTVERPRGQMRDVRHAIWGVAFSTFKGEFVKCKDSIIYPEDWEEIVRLNLAEERPDSYVLRDAAFDLIFPSRVGGLFKLHTSKWAAYKLIKVGTIGVILSSPLRTHSGMGHAVVLLEDCSVVSLVIGYRDALLQICTMTHLAFSRKFDNPRLPFYTQVPASAERQVIRMVTREAMFVLDKQKFTGDFSSYALVILHSGECLWIRDCHITK